MKCLLLVALLVACKSSDQRPRPATGSGSGSSGSAELNVSLAPEPVEPDLCDSFNRGAVVEAFGWKGMQKVSATGLKMGERRERHCAFRSLDDTYKDATFGLSFTTDLTFIAHHPGFEIDYAKSAPIDGMETWIGRNKDMVSLQVVTHGVRIIASVSRSGTPEEMEPRLVRATQKLVASLPAELIPMMHK